MTRLNEDSAKSILEQLEAGGRRYITPEGRQVTVERRSLGGEYSGDLGDTVDTDAVLMQTQFLNQKTDSKLGPSTIADGMPEAFTAAFDTDTDGLLEVSEYTMGQKRRINISEAKLRELREMAMRDGILEEDFFVLCTADRQIGDKEKEAGQLEAKAREIRRQAEEKRAEVARIRLQLEGTEAFERMQRAYPGLKPG